MVDLIGQEGSSLQTSRSCGRCTSDNYQDIEEARQMPLLARAKQELLTSGLYYAKPTRQAGVGVQHYLRQYVEHKVVQTPSAAKLKYKAFQNRIIAVTGIIGVGKSTAVELLADYLNSIGLPAKAFRETMNSKLLRQFYTWMETHPTEPNPHAMPLQTDMLNRCQRAYHEAKLLAKTGVICIIDGSIYSNLVFAAMHRQVGNMTEEDWGSYLESAKSLGSYEIDYQLHLWVKPEVAHERVLRRAREFEKDMPVEYLAELNATNIMNIREQASAGHSRISVKDNTKQNMPATEYLDLLLDESKFIKPDGKLGIADEDN